MKRKNKFNLIGALSIFTLIAIIVFVGSFMTSVDNEFTFSDGVYINGEQMKGQNLTNAYSLISNKITEQTDGLNIEILYQDKVWKITDKDLDTNKGVKEVLQKAVDGVTIDSYKTVDIVRTKGEYNISLRSVFSNFDSTIDEIANAINTDAVDSKVNFTPDKEKIFNITESKTGIQVDKEKLISSIEKQFLKTKDIKVYVPTIVVQPSINSDYYADKLNLMGSFSTDLTNSQEGRRFNVAHALEKFNGKVFESGETISYNEITGPQTSENGYKPATVILNGAFTQGIGGGICQASTTMYNACVLANLDILEVHKHTLMVKYVELGLDAMVSEGFADMQFKNSSDYPIYVRTYLNGDRCYVEIYGKTIPEDVTIKRTAEIIKTIGHNGDKIVPDTNGDYSNLITYKGEYFRLKTPTDGYEVKAYKEYYKNGELIKKEEIRHETYQPVDGVVMEGTSEVPEGYTIPKSDVEIIPKHEI